MPFREKLLIAPEAGPAGGKELFVNLRVIETGHRSAIKPQRARGHDHVRALQGGVSLGGRFDQIGTGLEQRRHAGVVREELWQVLVEFHVVGHDHA